MEFNRLSGYPSIDRPWLKYYSKEAIKASFPECTVWKNIYERNKEHLTDAALLYFGKKISYRKLFSEIDKTAKALTHLGVKNGDNVAICMPAVPEAIYTILALNKLGANAGMLNPTFSEEQLTDRVNEMDVNVLIVVNELYSTMKNVIPNTSIRHVIACPAVNSLGTFVQLIKKVKPIPETTSWNSFIRQGRSENYQTASYEKQKPAIMVFPLVRQALQKVSNSPTMVLMQQDANMNTAALIFKGRIAFSRRYRSGFPLVSSYRC